MRIVQAKLYIDRSYSENIHLEDITNEALYSKYHFLRTFKFIYGYTPKQYLQKVRIERAKEFLREGLKNKEVCEAVGFESVSSFLGLFKKKVGQTPAEFKQSYQRKRNKETSNPLSLVPGCFAGTLKE